MVKSKPKRRRNPLYELRDAALVWHAATYISCQEERDSKADTMLRRACKRYLRR
jgi:hypothetical protein